MKKLLLITLAFILAFSFPFSVYAGDQVFVSLNGLFINSNFNLEKDQYSLEHVSFLNSIGAKYTYNAKTKTLDITKDNKKVALTVDSATALVNGKKAPLTVPARYISKSLFVPVKFICDTYGIKYNVNKTSKLISLTVPKTAQAVKDIAKYTSAVVKINVYNAKKELLGNGSGFFVSDDGKIVTNYHVIDGAYSAEAVTADNITYPIVGVVNYSKDRDLAVLKVTGKTPFQTVPLGDSSKAVLGEEVVAIGSPLGLQNTVSEGIVSSIRPNIFRKAANVTDIQITAPISPGSSGGVLFNMNGEAIGVTYSGITEGENLNFVIPINEVKGYLNAPSYIPLKETNDNLKKIQAYNLIQNEYNTLQFLGVRIDNSIWNFILSYTFALSSNDFSFIKDRIDEYNDIIDVYNAELDNIKALQEVAYDAGVDISDMKSIISDYSDALDAFDAALYAVEKYETSKQAAEQTTIVEKLTASSKSSISAQNNAYGGYEKFEKLILDFNK